MTSRTALAALLSVALLATACSAGDDDPAPSDTPSSSATPSPSATTETPSPSPSPTPSATPAEPTSADPVVSRIGDEQWALMRSTGSWRSGCPAGRGDLRVLEVNYVDFSGDVQRGRLVANRDVMKSLSRIFERLFTWKFPIASMKPVEEFDGDTLESLKANNTSAYNCRRPDQINAPQDESPHANGRAIDINPDLNPWMDLRCKCWSPRAKHHPRVAAPGKILKDDRVVRLFEREGWIWQNIKVADYMHFDTGYPSRAWSSPRD
ncbi:M15 family metallopeptidase [Aeromicrobium massiliense]|uniref:M15 family metallopeptidase n=1 Tax=Aeromicrobium massiliense TaxID=1464554 RepID=UPI00030C46B9|nr:M15 family metallopeptidase [Aeromicrobium massiliense]